MKTKLCVCFLFLSMLFSIWSCDSDTDAVGPGDETGDPNPAPATNPVITSITATPDTVEWQESSNILCVAESPVGQDLSVGWAFSGGGSLLSGIGNNALAATFSATSCADEAVIICRVSDEEGRVTQDSVRIVVLNIPHEDNQPIIESVGSDKDTLVVNDIATITCEATDSDNDILGYAFGASGTGFTITPTDNANVIQWSASSPGTYQITCTVTDECLNEAVGSIFLSVN